MKRLIALLVAIIALACFAGCLFGLNWIWTVKKPLVDKATVAFGRVDDVLAVALKTIDDVQKNLQAARCTLQLTGSNRADGQRAPSFVESMMVRSAASLISPDMSSMQNSIEKVTEASIVVNSILESLHELEGIERLNTAQLRNLQSEVGRVTRASWELGGMLAPATDESEAQKSARIMASLEQVIALVEQYQKQAELLRQKVGQYKDESLYWLNLGPKLATVALIWIALSQLIVIVAMMRIARASPAAHSQ